MVLHLGNATRQLVPGYTADGDTTGLYPFTLMVRHQYASGPHDATAGGTLLVVNRRASPFGAGWGLAGVERLSFPSGNRLLWLAGDGSAAVYDSVAAGTWVRAPGAFRDTIVRNPGPPVTYTRRLRHGVTVTFGATGRLTQTTNRTGHATVFGYSASGDRLKTITVPPAGQSGTTYSLAYASGMLDKITDPAGRVLDATVTGGNLTALKDPDNVTVTFGYDGARRLTSRTNRRGYSLPGLPATATSVLELPLAMAVSEELNGTPNFVGAWGKSCVAGFVSLIFEW